MVEDPLEAHVNLTIMDALAKAQDQLYNQDEEEDEVDLSADLEDEDEFDEDDEEGGGHGERSVSVPGSKRGQTVATSARARTTPPSSAATSTFPGNAATGHSQSNGKSPEGSPPSWPVRKRKRQSGLPDDPTVPNGSPEGPRGDPWDAEGES